MSRAVRYCPGCGFRVGIRVTKASVNGQTVAMYERAAVPPEQSDELIDFAAYDAR
jgi:hypothetical protein